MALPSRPHHLLSELRNNGTHSDLTIKCGDSEFKVHKCIVCPQSFFFEKACEEGKWKEGYTNVIELKAAEEDRPDPADDDPRAVKLMIDYLYLDDYHPGTIPASLPAILAPELRVGDESIDRPTADPLEDPDLTGWGGFPLSAKEKKARKKARMAGFRDLEFSEPEPESESKPSAPDSTRSDANFLELHAKVFATASKYHIGSLKHTARMKFKEFLRHDWAIADIIASMEVVFNHTPEGELELRNALKDALVRHAITLVQCPGFQEAVESIDGLAYDLFCRRTYAEN